MQDSAVESQYKGRLVLIVGPSGSGKGTVISILKKRHPDWIYPISYTTRKRRPTEVDGEVYHFLSREDFEKGIEDGDFLEYAIVHSNNYYGTSKKDILNALEQGKIVVREIDIQGFESIKEVVPAENLTSIFLMVDSLDDLIGRILKRGKLPEEEIKRRMQSAQNEIAKKDKCDFVVPSVTGQVEQCADQVEKLILERA
ncbi:guanylate kinase [Patescibacteria group bacterium]|nr:guanylate kinase [Patescibacteria group bacterium]